MNVDWWYVWKWKYNGLNFYICSCITDRIDAKYYHQMKHNGKKCEKSFLKTTLLWCSYLRYTYFTVCSSNSTVYFVAFQSKSKSDYLRHAIRFRDGGTGLCVRPLNFGRSVNPISNQAGRLCPPHYYLAPAAPKS